MFEILAKPEIVTLSGSKMIFKVASDRVEDYLRIVAAPYTDPEQGSDLLPVKDGEVSFDLHEYFKDFTKSGYSLQSLVELHDQACKPVNIKFFEYFGNPPELQNEISYDGYVLGGLIPNFKEREFKRLFTSFKQFIDVAKPFLTFFRDIKKKVLPDQPERLYFLSQAGGLLRLMVTLRFEDGETAFYQPDISIDTLPFQVVSFATGFDQLQLQNYTDDYHQGKKIKEYEVCLTDALHIQVTEPFFYQPDYRSYRNKKFIVFRNSLSGFDTLACTGEYDEVVQVDRMTAEAVPEVKDKPGKIEYSRKDSEFLRVNTGYLPAGEKAWLNDLFISDEIYEVEENRLYRILLKSKELIKNDNVFTPSDLELEFERLHSI